MTRANRNPLWRLVPLLRGERGMIAIILVCLGLKVLCDLAMPWGIKWLIDDILPSLDGTRLAVWAAIMTAAVIVGSLVTAWRIVIAGGLAARVLARLRDETLARALTLSGAFHARHPSGDLIARLTSDIDRMQYVVQTTLPSLLFQVASLIAFGALAVHLNGLLAALVLVVAGPLFAWMYVRINRRLAAASRALQDELGSMATTAAEHLATRNVIQAFSLETWARSRFGERLRRIGQGMMRIARLDATLTGGSNLVFWGVNLFVLIAGAVLVMNGQLTLGALIAFQSIVSGLLAPFITVGDQFAEIQAAAGALSRVLEVLDAPSDIPGGRVEAGPLQREIRFEGVSVRYGGAGSGAQAALTDVSATIRAGTFVALVGASGSGKSTFIGLLARQQDPGAGRVTYDGVDLREFSLPSLRRQVALVPQDTRLFDLSILENVALGLPGAGGEGAVASGADARLSRALRDAALHVEQELGPEGAARSIGEQGSRLSGGQRQRVAIARALVGGAPVIAMDEPTAALDGAAESTVIGTLERLRAEGRTLIVATHRRELAEQADVILVFEAGRIIQTGSPRFLLGEGGPYRDLVEAIRSGDRAAVDSARG